MVKQSNKPYQKSLHPIKNVLIKISFLQLYLKIDHTYDGFQWKWGDSLLTRLLYKHKNIRIFWIRLAQIFLKIQLHLKICCQKARDHEYKIYSRKVIKSQGFSKNTIVGMYQMATTWTSTTGSYCTGNLLSLLTTHICKIQQTLLTICLSEIGTFHSDTICAFNLFCDIKLNHNQFSPFTLSINYIP